MRLFLQDQIENGCMAAVHQRLKTKTMLNKLETSQQLFDKLCAALLQYADSHFDTAVLISESNRQWKEILKLKDEVPAKSV